MAEGLWTPPGADLGGDTGYNMPGTETPSGQPGSAQPGGFWGRVKGAAKSMAGEYVDRATANTPEWMSNSDMPQDVRDREAVKWAFHGTRTTHTHSLAHEQNMYGGVQRNAIPTERITMQKRQMWDQAGNEEAQDRRMLNYEEMYPSPQGAPPDPEMTMGRPMPAMGIHQTVNQAAWQGAMAGSGGNWGTPGQPEGDPLFAKNTGAMPFNMAQMGTIHQRMTAGSQ